MRKTYPYLQNVYSPNLNEEAEKRYFLKYIDDFVNQRQYIKLTLLDWEENPIKAIEGIISSGSMSKDGSSAVRRTCNLSCSVDGESYNVDDMEMDFTLNRKIFIEFGVKNDSPYYTEYPILWFPQGVFFITSFSMNSSSSSAVNLSLGLKDKMALLNGDIGGKLPSTVRFDSMETQLSSGEWVEQKVLIYNIINELVNHYGGEDLNNIIIEDIPLRVRAVMKWIGENPVYGKVDNNSESGVPEQWTFSLSPFEDNYYYTFKYGDDVGYIYQDFVVTKELYGAPGDSVCTILDQIKKILGNYEYFYDEMGIFHFREIKNFLNVTQGEFVLDAMSENDYFIETTNEKAVYAFEDNSNITSITVTPQYENIKNDYIVHGLRPGDSKENASLIMYHLVIDQKPQYIGTDNKGAYYQPYFNIVCYTDPLDGLNKLAIVDQTPYPQFSELPVVGNFNKVYYVEGYAPTKDSQFVKNKTYYELTKKKKYTPTSDTTFNSNKTYYEKSEDEDKVYYWDNTLYKELTFKEQDSEGNTKEITISKKSKYYYSEYRPRDWRTFFYLKGLEAQAMGTDEGEYFAELNAFWPKEYDLRHDVQDWFVHQSGKKQNSYSILSQGNYFLDFIDTNSQLGKYSVSSIGKRSDVVQSDDINCVFEPEIPNTIFLNVDYPTDNISQNTTLYDDIGTNKSDKNILDAARRYCDNNGHPWTQVREDIYSNLAIGGYSNSAYERIRYELFCHSNYQKTVSLTSIPVYYLEPNSRVVIRDASTNTYGDFMVQNINLTFGPGANMAVTLNEVHERL